MSFVLFTCFASKLERIGLYFLGQIGLKGCLRSGFSVAACLATACSTSLVPTTQPAPPAVSQVTKAPKGSPHCGSFCRPFGNKNQKGLFMSKGPFEIFSQMSDPSPPLRTVGVILWTFYFLGDFRVILGWFVGYFSITRVLGIRETIRWQSLISTKHHHIIL